MQTILVTDQAKLWNFANQFTTVVSAIQYISDNNFTNTDSIRVINLCKSYQYQSLGYYVSLLAEARGHKINPSTVTIQDINKFLLPLFEDDSLEEEVQRSLKNIKSNQFILSIYFGKNIAKQYEKICHKFYNLCPLPLFRIYFRKRKTWKIIKIAHISILDVPDNHREFLETSAYAYFNKKRFRQYKDKKFNFDMAILYNEEEKTAPSNPAAIQKFIQAGEELGINSEVIDKGDLRFIAEYDALFIRETTAVNHHTYQFSRRAEAEGLVVIDDPGSILKCTNKVFLSELLAKHKVPHPKTHLISKHKWKEFAHNIPTPCVLKKPDGAFSHGVIKIENETELCKNLMLFFQESQLVVAQEFVPTEFDWRICILDNEPLFACRYYMAKGHWQVYNWESQAQEKEGRDECVALADVPSQVLKVAIRACRPIGRGLYGVDIKQNGKKCYVIEINDNPNIDVGIEDKLLGDSIYRSIMQFFLKEIRLSHGYK